MSFGGLAALGYLSALALPRALLGAGASQHRQGRAACPLPVADASLSNSRQVCPLLAPLCAWLRCPACCTPGRARRPPARLSSRQLTAGSAARVRPSARGRAARLDWLSLPANEELDASASPTATTQYRITEGGTSAVPLAILFVHGGSNKIHR